MAEIIPPTKMISIHVVRIEVLLTKIPRIRKIPQNHSIQGSVTAKYLTRVAELKIW
jgi:hypothetical protein